MVGLFLCERRYDKPHCVTLVNDVLKPKQKAAQRADFDPVSGDVILSYSTRLSYVEVMTEFGFIWSIDEDNMISVYTI